MKIIIASDHAGFERKQKIISFLRIKGMSISDKGPDSLESVDYPDFANLVCFEFKNLISTSEQLGILICGSGQGMAMRANKFSFIRAALCWNEESAALAREHNDANILCFGSRLVDEKMSEKIVEKFISTSFAGGRHSQRVVKISSPI